MKKLLLISSLLFTFSIDGQTFIQTYQDRANLVSLNNINTYLQEFESLGIKRTGTTANNNTFNWIKGKYETLGFTPSQIQEQAWTNGGYSSKNLIVTKTGSLYPNKYVIVCGHFDTINGPGVNDNGSGTSILLEVARILKDVETDYSIKFIHFSGEEQGLLGSSKYVSEIVNGTNPKMDIKLVINIDQVGGLKNGSNTKVYCDQDESIPSSNNAAAAIAVQELANCTTLYSPLSTEFTRAENTDYVPFQQNGEIITGFWEFEGGYDNRFVHTANDKYVNMDPVYVYNVGKATVGAVQHFSVADTSLLSSNETTISKSLEALSIYPNPVKNVIYLNINENQFKDSVFTITDISGKKVLSIKNNPSKIDITNLEPGTYFGTLTVGNENVTRKFIKL